MKTLPILIALLITTVICTQNIKGKVTDVADVIPFANVIFSGTEIGTLTNFKGEFELSSSSRKKELTVQLLGYETQKLKLNNKNLFLKITLLEGEQLSEVIVVQKPKKRLKKNGDFRRYSIFHSYLQCFLVEIYFYFTMVFVKYLPPENE